MVKGLHRGTPPKLIIYERSPFVEYMKVASESDGFEVTNFGRLVCGGIIVMDKTNREHFGEAIEAARFAVDDHNRTQLVGGFMYYITLRAHSRTRKRPEFYQAKVYRKLNDDMVVKIFRERPKPCQTLAGSSSAVENAEENVTEPLTLRKGAFIKFRNDIKKIPELVNMRDRYVANLASKVWRTMTFQEKARYSNSISRKSLRYEDVEDYLSDISD